MINWPWMTEQEKAKLGSQDNQLIEWKRLQLQGGVLKELVDEVERSDRHEPDRARKKMCCIEFRMGKKRNIHVGMSDCPKWKWGIHLSDESKWCQMIHWDENVEDKWLQWKKNLRNSSGDRRTKEAIPCMHKLRMLDVEWTKRKKSKYWWHWHFKTQQCVNLMSQ